MSSQPRCGYVIEQWQGTSGQQYATLCGKFKPCPVHPAPEQRDTVTGQHINGCTGGPCICGEPGYAQREVSSQQDAAQPKCFDCHRPYGDEHGFPDLVVPHDIWRRISPSGNEGSLLCPSCICKRLYDAGIETTGLFRSGPLAVDESLTVIAAAERRAYKRAAERVRALSWRGERYRDEVAEIDELAAQLEAEGAES